jgi:hypothetical protein
LAFLDDWQLLLLLNGFFTVERFFATYVFAEVGRVPRWPKGWRFFTFDYKIGQLLANKTLKK